MNKVEIYEFQLKQIETTLRMCANALNSYGRETCIDRDVMASWQMVKNALKGDIDKRVNRMGETK